MARFSPAWFSLCFCLSYPVFLAFDGHLFLYYPLINQWSFSPPKGATGPAMQWYGLIASAGLAGLVAGVVLPKHNLAFFVSRSAVIAAVAAMLACVYLLRDFFV